MKPQALTARRLQTLSGESLNPRCASLEIACTERAGDGIVEGEAHESAFLVSHSEGPQPHRVAARERRLSRA